MPVIPPRFHAAVVALVATLVLLVNLGGPALWDEDEPKNAACTLAMLQRNDWVVPTFNGRLRVEKPALVNWLHLAGFSVAGRNETGARLGSAVLSLGTCLLTWRIGLLCYGPTAGLLGGLAMASCIWTAVGGRSATPDAPLVFFTTLGLWCFVAGWQRYETLPATAPGGGVRLETRFALACGASLGAAILAKGPVGLVLPLGVWILFTLWQAAANALPGRLSAFTVVTALAVLRLPLILAAAGIVALPWYAWVTARTGGAWLEGFLLVHNVGRFASPMEGHGGSSIGYYPAVLAIGFFPWSIVLAAVLFHTVATLVAARSAKSPPENDVRCRSANRLLLLWLGCWVVAFSASGTKLPGYVWPAYPALAVLTGEFLAAWARGDMTAVRWCRRPEVVLQRVMQLAWSILLVVGVGVAVGLPVAAMEIAPRLAWLAPIGLVLVIGAVAAWRFQSAGTPHRSLAALAVSACLFVSLLAGIGGGMVDGSRGAQRLIASLGRTPAADAWASFSTVPPSVVFYANATIPQLESTEEVTAHLEGHPDAHLVVDARFQMNLPASLPAGFGVIARQSQLFGPGLLIIGPLPAAHSPFPPPQSENPLAWNAPVTPR